MIELEIDGKKVSAEPGSMIIQVADTNGQYIPRFCYHKKLSIAANCRMCLVEVEKVGKPVPACATPISQGMRVFTKSSKALAAQRAVMEFLLINHPLDCPICDQGGECELQDMALGYGDDISRFSEKKRAVDDENLGSLIATDMTRCIHCTRCVRFGTEVAGMRELGTLWRGEHMEIKTFVGKSLASEVSGNIIDLCPVGALTSKPYRYTARAWELQQRPSIAPHDCLGAHINVHVRRDQVMRVVPKANEQVNETWASDRDRFSYTGLYSDDRLSSPMLKQVGRWQEVSWEVALQHVADELKKTIGLHGPQQLAGIISPSATLEEQYLFAQIIRGLGSHNLDHRIRQTDTADQNSMPLIPGFIISIAEMELQKSVLLIGCHIQHEQPLLAIRLRKASLQGAAIMAINPMNFAHSFDLHQHVVCHPMDMVQQLGGIVKALSELNNKPLPATLGDSLAQIEISAQHKEIAKSLSQQQPAALILGALAEQHPQAALLRQLAYYIAELSSADSSASSSASINFLTAGSNSAGAWLAGCVPHRKPAGLATHDIGLTASESFEQKLKSYVLFGLEPEQDCANPMQVTQSLAAADSVIALTAYKSDYLLQHADVLLPIGLFNETSGTFINVAGQWQSFAAVTPAKEQVKPGWKVLRVLANLLDLPGFDYTASTEIRDELQKLSAHHGFNQTARHELSLPQAMPKAAITRLSEWPMYRVDSVVRRALPLQQAASHEPVGLRINSMLAQRLSLHAGDKVQVKQGEGQANLTVIVDERVPENCALIAAGFPETHQLADSFGEITIHA